MSDCAKISGGILLDCTTPLQAGTKDVLYLFNFSDFEDATIQRNNTNPQIIEGITFASGVTGFRFEGKNNSINPMHEYVKGAYFGSYSHQVNFKAMALGPEVKKQLELMTNGRVVAITENNYKGTTGNAAFEIYGLDAGLIVDLLQRDPSSSDTQGAYDITIKSSEKSREAHLPASIFITDYATTKALVEGLIA